MPDEPIDYKFRNLRYALNGAPEGSLAELKRNNNALLPVLRLMRSLEVGVG